MTEAVAPELRETLRDIAKLVETAAGKKGFALFFEAAGNFHYASNGHRDDIVKSLEEWLERTKRTGALCTKEDHETSEQVDVRLELERKCAEIGKVIASRADVVLFLFDWGEGGNMAYFTNIPKAREGVQRWIHAFKSMKNG